jgi:Holliday junction DNA helicase RuvA
MISHLAGIVKEIKEKAIVLDIGAIAFTISVPQETSFTVDQKVNLHIYMHWNQDQGPSLFGFGQELEKKVFLMIIDCSGIGPRIALSILESMSPQQFLEVIQAGDDKSLSKVNGIGAKKAEQMIVQLKHKVAKLLDSGIEITGSAQLTHWQNISQVLESLNYTKSEIAAAMKYVRDNEPQIKINAPFDHMMRRALSFLSKKA